VLSPEVVAFVTPRIESILQENRDGLVGVCSLAAGADQLFARFVLEIGGDLHVIIPSNAYESTFVGESARKEYHGLLERARSVETLDFDEPCEGAFLEAGRRGVEMSDLLIAIWDGRPARGMGGTGDIVDVARELGRRVEVLWPPGVNR
jgi:hypothetical protein